MLYTINWIEEKKSDWKVASIKDLHGIEVTDVSINKVDKKGRAFPDFDNLSAGQQVEGNLWRSPAGKYTLFAPDAKGTPSPRTYAGGARPGNASIAKNMETKHEHVQEAQANKGRGIMISAAFRDATLIVLELARAETPWTFDEIKAKHKEVRDWYIAQWKTKESEEDVPF